MLRDAANVLPEKCRRSRRRKKYINRVLKKKKKKKKGKEHTLLLVTLLFLQFITGITDRARVIHGLGSPWGRQVCNRSKRPVLCARGQRA